MPSDKRARKRAAREAKLAAAQRAQRRRATVRRTITIIILVGAAAGIYALVSGGGTKNAAGKKGAGTSTTIGSATTTTPTTTTTLPTTTTTLAAAQVAADQASVVGGCPSSPHAALNKATYAHAPAMAIDTTKTYTATVKTDVGSFVVTLDAKASPVAVNSFVFLAQKGYFNCVIFHRVIPNFVVQGGDPTGTGTGGPGYQFTESGPPTAANGAHQYPLGGVAMANSNRPATPDPTTNGSQFFIVTGTNGEALPPDYVLFGQVTSGMNVVNQISTDGSSAGVPPTITHRMISVTIAKS